MGRHVKQPEATQQCDVTHQRPSDKTVATRSNTANAMQSNGVKAKRHYAANATLHDGIKSNDRSRY